MCCIALSGSYLCRLREWFIHQLSRRLGLLFLSSINTQPTLNLMPWGRCCPSTITSQVCACGSFTFPRQALNHQPGHSVLFFITAHPGAFSWSGLNQVYFKTQGWLALHGGGGYVTLLYVHRWSAILACLLPDSLWLCFGWRCDEITCVCKCMSECLYLRCWTLTSRGSLGSWSWQNEGTV